MPTHKAIPLLGLFCVGATLAAAPAGPDGDPLTLDYLRDALETYSFEVAEAYYQSDAYGAEIEIDELLERYAWLYDPAIVDWIHGLRTATDDTRTERGLRYLARDLEDVLLWEPIEELYIEYLEAEIAGGVEYGDEWIAYRDVWTVADELETDDEREELRDLARDFIQNELHPLQEEYRRGVGERCRELGYADYLDYYGRTRGRDFAALAADCLYILAETRELYETLADERVAEVYPERERLLLSSIERWRLWDDEEYDAHFTAEKLLPRWEAFINDLGLDFNQRDNVTLDAEDRPAKEPRAACWPMLVPEDVRVMVKPTGGFDDYATLFHEMGHACHFAYTDPALTYEYQQLGDDAITETYAFCFENLFVNPAYLREVIGMSDDDARRFRRRRLFGEVGALRYYCTAFLYELVFHGVEADPAEAYRNLIEMTTIWTQAPEDLLTGIYDTNEDFYTTNYLYAWMLEAQLRHRLETDHGPRWWSEPAAGKLVHDLWRQGYQLLPQTLSAELGYDDCDPRRLLTTLEELEADTQPD